MPSLSITLDGAAAQVIGLVRPRTTLGRRPYNDIVVDHLAVSGEHALFVLHPDGVELIDLHSTNGTYVNGRSVDALRIGPADLIEIGRCQIRLVEGELVVQPVQSAAAAFHPSPPSAARASDEVPTASPPSPPARLRLLGTAAAGKEMTLLKPHTTVGKPGVAVAAIARSSSGHTLAWVEGSAVLLNGAPVTEAPVALAHLDQIVVAGIELQFLLD
ncbi:FHA domain-containing protein [Serpentinimonas barnesii]|uniref:FHA domain-containing protein n=1 Tax=Serpentinimonas barnesii TaxID=1458427 RepID=UPI000497F268|nr:FHA domain-containing protein [Serpentinimonas barnesii]